MTARRILYLSYDGVLEPLGQSQVLAYLEKLAPGRTIHLISYEKSRDWSDAGKRAEIAARITAAGIRWHPLKYHKSPSAPATAYDIAVGTAVATSLALRHGLTIVHARSYVAALVGLGVKRATGARLLFDIRGLWADERVDGGLWRRNGRLHRFAKRVERRLLTAADHVVTLTHASAAEIAGFPYLADEAPPISVIPTCADLERFTVRDASGDGPFTLGYVGSVGTWYLLDEMLRCFVLLRGEVPDARLLMVNRNEQDLIRSRGEALGIEGRALEVVGADHHEMPRLIARMTAGLAMYNATYSRIACAPTKLGEYLGCGVPCLGTAGVGDMEAILERRRVGVVVRDLSDQGLGEAVRRLVALTHEPDLQQRCRDVAVELFSLGRGVAAYARIYDALAADPAKTS